MCVRPQSSTTTQTQLVRTAHLSIALVLSVAGMLPIAQETVLSVLMESRPQIRAPASLQVSPIVMLPLEELVLIVPPDSGGMPPM